MAMCKVCGPSITGILLSLLHCMGDAGSEALNTKIPTLWPFIVEPPLARAKMSHFNNIQ